MRFLNERRQNYNELGDKVDSFCEDCEKKWFPFSFLWWDDNKNNIADIKRKDNGILVINKILSLINSILSSIKDIYERIDIIEPPIISEKTVELVNNYLEVGVTEESKQEDLNIAFYENYINLKNTKVDKPLIESTSDSLKIVALDNQGESVFIKSNELGKVKSVNNKIGDVILKTSDLENDSDYTTNLKLNQERDERISGDNLKLDKPTTSGTTTTHPNIVGVDDLGNSAKLKATDFGKVKSVNGKEGDVILKTSDLENDSDYTTNATLAAHTSNKANPHNVTKEQLGLGNVDNTSDLNKPISTATQIELNKKINKPTTNNTPDYVLLADGSTAPKSDFGKVDKVMGVFPDANKNVDISGVAMNWTHASQRMSALVSKHNDATYNRLLGMDANGNLNEVGLPALTNEMSKATDAQKEAFRVASRKTGETYSTGQPRVDTILPPVIDNTKDYIQYTTLVGLNLFFNNSSPSTALVKIIRYKDIDNNLVPETIVDITNYQVYQKNTSILSFGIRYDSLLTGYYKVQVTHNGLINIGSSDILVTTQVTNNPIILDSWETYTPFEPNNLIVTNTSLKKTYGGVIRGSTVIEQQVKHFIIKKEDVLSGFRLNFVYKLTPTGTELGNVMARSSITFGLGYDQNINNTVVPDILISFIRGVLSLGLTSSMQPSSSLPLIYEIDLVVKNSLATVIVTLKNTGKVTTETFSFEQRNQQMYFYSTFLGSNPDTPAQISGSTQELLFQSTYQSF